MTEVGGKVHFPLHNYDRIYFFGILGYFNAQNAPEITSSYLYFKIGLG